MAAENMVTENMKMREREISLLDLLVEILLHWRIILVVMLLGGIVFGGLGYGRAKEREQAAEARRQVLEEQRSMSREELLEQWEAQGISLRSRLDDAQLARVNTALIVGQRYEERFDYSQHSLLMQLDPMKIQQADLTFAIRADDAGGVYSAYSARAAYEQLLMSAAFFEYVEERCGLEDGVSELISLKQLASGAQDSLFLVNGSQDGAFVLGVRLRHDNADICSAMADAAEEFIRQQQKELEQTIGSHEVILLSSSQGVVADWKVADAQNVCTNNLYSFSTYYTALMKAIEGEELAYYNYLVAGSPADSGDTEAQENGVGQEEAVAGAAAATARVSVKYVLLGMIMFAGIYVFALFIKYIMNNRLRSADSLCELYGIPQLGTVPALSPKRFLGAVDQWILKLRYHNQRRFTREESVGLAAVAVKMAALKKGTKEVCLLGCELKENTLEICGQIKGQLEAAGLEVNLLNNVLYDAEAMERLGSVGSVVLVETAGVTLYDEILKELELLSRQEIAVLGGIVAE